MQMLFAFLADYVDQRNDYADEREALAIAFGMRAAVGFGFAQIQPPIM